MKQRTISDIIKQKDKWMTPEVCIEPSRKRQKMAKHEGMEEALCVWLCGIRAKNGVITVEILCNKAKQFGAGLGITEFMYMYMYMYMY